MHRTKQKIIAGLILLTNISCFAADTEFTDKIRSITTNIIESVSDIQKKVVAITDFTDLEGNITTLGRFFAEEITITLVQSTKQINVIDRLQLSKLLIDRHISNQGIIDPALAKQIAQVSGAEVIITGSVYPVANSVYLSVKIIDVNSAKIYAAGSVIIPRDRILDDLIKSTGLGITQQKETTTDEKPFSPQVRQADVFVFVLKEVVCENNVLTLNMTIRNSTSELRYLTIDTVRAVDNIGNERFPSLLTVGGAQALIGERGRIYSTRKKGISDRFDIRFLPGEELKMRVNFRNISSKATAIGFLEMIVAPVSIRDSRGTFARLENDPITIQFTDISIPGAENVSRQ